MTDLQPIGGGANPFAAPPWTLSSQEILRVLELDPRHSMDRGRLRAIRERLDRSRRGAAPSPEQAKLDAALRIEPKRNGVSRYDNPARLTGPKPKPHPLSAGTSSSSRALTA